MTILLVLGIALGAFVGASGEGNGGTGGGAGDFDPCPLGAAYTATDTGHGCVTLADITREEVAGDPQRYGVLVPVCPEDAVPVGRGDYTGGKGWDRYVCWAVDGNPRNHPSEGGQG